MGWCWHDLQCLPASLYLQSYLVAPGDQLLAFGCSSKRLSLLNHELVSLGAELGNLPRYGIFVLELEPIRHSYGLCLRPSQIHQRLQLLQLTL